MIQSMRKLAKTALLAGVALLVFDTAFAASISARVRILESKVKKHDRQIRANTKGLSAQRKALGRQVQRLSALEKRVDHIESQLKKKQHPRVDKRYSYP